MTNLPCKPSRIDFDAITPAQIERILRHGDLDSLTEAERAYLDMMEVVRGLRARMMLPGGKRVVTKSGIIKLLKSDVYGLSDWMARQIYADALNFFYTDDKVSPKAWANLYAEKLEKWADLSAATGKLKEARGYLVEAAKLRRCYDEQEAEIPMELLNAAPVVIYTNDAESMGAPKADRREIEQIINSIPDIPEMSRQRVMEDAGVTRRNLLSRMMEDAKEFGDEEKE